MQASVQITVGVVIRQFLYYIPDEILSSKKYPVIISFHGTLGSAAQMMGFADFRPLADSEKFIIVCPEGITQTWNDGRATKANLQGIDDVAFIKALIIHLIENYAVNPRNVFLTGISNGGFMVSRLACELPDLIAGIAVVAATMDKTSGLLPAKPLPAVYIHGTRDRLVPYDGGATKAAGGNVYSHEEVIAIWLGINDCSQEPAVVFIPDCANDETTVIQKRFNNPFNNLSVLDFTIVNGGHTWPGGPQYAPVNFVGLVSHNLNACKIIWDFFKQYLAM